MKISIMIKALMIIMLGGFLFFGCGGGDGEICYTNCSGSGGDNGGDDGTGGDGGGDDESSDGAISAHLRYDSLEYNITDYRGMFNLVAPNQVEPEDLDNHSVSYQKEIIYHDVDVGIASRLYSLMDGFFYPEVACIYEDSPPYCEVFARTNLPSSLVTSDGIKSVFIAFNQGEATGCADGPVCDITLIVRADSKYQNNTNNGIQLNLFKQAVVEDDIGYIYGNDMKNVLRDIERNATAVSLVTYTRYLDMNLSAYSDVNRTIRTYTDQLTVNNGSRAQTTSPQIPMQSSGDDGQGATQYFNGALYGLGNKYVFESKPVDYDVNETDLSGPHYWMANVSTPDDFNMITLCQKTVNATSASQGQPATNATYTCEEGKGNITSNWTILGQDVDLSWW
ncbi:MAG: hypothetical protein LBH45_02735 [Campylobacteraceae bacterium]|nr:hypothetical protein [Campylobacteraceae bacterium]